MGGSLKLGQQFRDQLVVAGGPRVLALRAVYGKGVQAGPKAFRIC